MRFFCKFCDKSIMNNSKYNHSKSISNKMLSKSSMRRYNLQKPNINDIDEILRKHIIIYSKNTKEN